MQHYMNAIYKTWFIQILKIYICYDGKFIQKHFVCISTTSPKYELTK